MVNYNDFFSKSKTMPILAKVSTPSMRSNIRSSALSLTSMILGLMLKYLDFEYAGNHISKEPIFVLSKVLFGGFQRNGTYLLLFSMLRNILFLIKIRLPYDPESRKHLQARFGCSIFSRSRYIIATIATLMPSLLTPDLVVICVVLSTV